MQSNSGKCSLKALAIISVKFWKKLEFYTNGKVKFNIFRATRKTKSLFKIKDNVKYFTCVIYQGICSYGHNYIDEPSET